MINKTIATPAPIANAVNAASTPRDIPAVIHPLIVLEWHW